MKSFILLLAFSMAASAQTVTGLAGWNLFVDPGHSQNENMGVWYSEAQQNLGTALHLQDLFMTLTDIDTVYSSRTNSNQQVSLAERCAHANNLGAAWFHSIHSNAGGSTANNTLLLWGQLYNGNPDPPVGGEAVSDIMIELISDAMRIPQSSWGSIGDCSFYTWNDYCQTSGGPYLYVNRNTNMPSELSEQGYHTNPPHNQNQMNDMWKRTVAYSMFWTFLDHHEIPRPYSGVLVGVIRDSESNVPINGATVSVDGQTYTTDSYESLFYLYSNDPDELHNGYYFFENLPDTVHEVVFSAPGYDSDTLSTAMVSDFITFLDAELVSTTPPYVVFSEPAQGDTLHPSWDTPYLDFSRPMDEASVDSVFSLVPEADAHIWWNNQHDRFAFVLDDTLEFLTEYTLTIPGTATDLYGHPLDGNGDGIGGDDFVLTFRTGPPDLHAPIVMTTYPMNGDTVASTRPALSVTYDEILNPDLINNEMVRLEWLYDLSDVPAIIEYHSVNEHGVIQVYPEAELDPMKRYRIRVFPGIEDEGGTATENGLTVTFWTPNYEYNTTAIDAFEGSWSGNWLDPQGSGSTTGIVTELTSRAENTEILQHGIDSQGSMELNYGWDTSADVWLIREYLYGGAPRNVMFDDQYIMQAWVFGDGAGNQMRFCVDDNQPSSAAVDHEVSPWIIVDWYGWKLVEWNMSVDGTGTWIGDGTLDGNMRFDSFQLTYTPGSSDVGTYYFDDLRVVTRNYLAIDENEAQVPLEFALLPNYPNPFNPSTTIPFILKEAGDVSISLYSIKGERLQQIFRGHLGSGYHETRLDGSQLASGTYLVRLETNGLSTAQKLTIMK